MSLPFLKMRIAALARGEVDPASDKIISSVGQTEADEEFCLTPILLSSLLLQAATNIPLPSQSWGQIQSGANGISGWRGFARARGWKPGNSVSNRAVTSTVSAPVKVQTA